MRMYVVASGAVFALVALAHVARVVAEGTGPLSDPMFVVSTILSVVLSAWAIVVLRRNWN
jgi:hypothetical protein